LVAERQILQRELAARLKSSEQDSWDGRKEVEHGRQNLGVQSLENQLLRSATEFSLPTAIIANNEPTPKGP
jgi:hypothetical protein